MRGVHIVPLRTTKLRLSIAEREESNRKHGLKPYLPHVCPSVRPGLTLGKVSLGEFVAMEGRGQSDPDGEMLTQSHGTSPPILCPIGVPVVVDYVDHSERENPWLDGRKFRPLLR